MSARDNILGRIRAALEKSADRAEREEINALTQNRVSDIKSAVKSLGWV
jgi:hypothetical protein